MPRGGFKDGGCSTDGPGTLLNVVLRGPKAADIYHPALPSGTYTCGPDNSSFTFGRDERSYVMVCAEQQGSDSSSRVAISGGSIVVEQRDNGFYSVHASVTTKSAGMGEFAFSYSGRLMQINQNSWLPGTVYEVDAPDLLSAVYDKDSGDYMLTLSGVGFSPDGLISSGGDGVVLIYNFHSRHVI